MGNHAPTAELFYGGVWNTVPMFLSGSLSTSRGAAAEGQDASPSTAELTANNASGDYSPNNPTSAIYGTGNLPLRVSADGEILTVVEAASIAPDRTEDGVKRWSDIGGAGILSRLGQGKTPLKSAMFRAIEASGPALWWPLETGDGRVTVSAPSGLAGGDPLVAEFSSAGSHQLSGAVGGATTGPAGAGGAIDLSGGGQLHWTGSLTAGPTAWRWEMAFYFKDPVDALESGQLVRITTDPGTLYGVFCIADAGIEFVFEASDGDTNVGETTSLIFDDGAWHHLAIEVAQNGANSDYLIEVDGATVFDATAAGIAYALPTDIVISPTGDLDAASQAVLWTDLPAAGFGYDAFTGHAGELAGVRFLRVAGELGIPAVVLGDETDTQPMGPQPVDTGSNILAECVRTDDGMLFDARTDRGVAMRPGRTLLNQDPVLTLDFAAKHIAAPGRPTFDNQRTRNDITVKNRFGGQAQARQLTGPKNLQDPTDDPEGVGLLDESVDVNAASDAQLAGMAGVRLARGTVLTPRFPQVVIDLDRHPSLQPDVDAIEIGDRVDVVNPDPDWSVDDLRLLVIGIRNTLESKLRRVVTLIVIPADAYEAAIVGENDGSTDMRLARVDTDATGVAAGGWDSTDTTVQWTSTGATRWTTDPDDWDDGLPSGGLFVRVGGEVAQVTSITGSGATQDVVLVRSVNGVVKAHAAGTPVHAAYPARVGL